MFKIARQYGSAYQSLAVACNNCELPGKEIADLENEYNLSFKSKTDDKIQKCLEAFHANDQQAIKEQMSILKESSLHPVPVCTNAYLLLILFRMDLNGRGFLIIIRIVCLISVSYTHLTLPTTERV